MIKFFRKIRQKLLSESKFSKYLLYAIGEIILVVIGILIALQINTWNQDKKDRKLEKQYYCRLLEDVKQDYSNYEYSLELLNGRIDANNSIIQRLLDDNLPLDSITPYLLKSVKFANRNYRATTDALEDIKSSRNLNILTDLSFKNKLTSYYESMARTSSIIETNGKAITDKRFFEKKDLVSSGWIKIAEELDGIDTTKVDLDLLNSKVDFTTEIRELLINDAIFYLGINSRNKQILKSIKNEILSTKSLLEGKCQNKKD